jgi:hypothetical protein
MQIQFARVQKLAAERWLFRLIAGIHAGRIAYQRAVEAASLKLQPV